MADSNASWASLQRPPALTPDLLPTWARALVVLLICGSMAWLVLLWLQRAATHDAPRRQTVRIALLPDAPPPPPPPPPPVRPVTPDAPRATAAPTPTTPAPPQQPVVPHEAPALRMEGAATDAASPFAAGTVRQDYTGQPIGAGEGGGSNARLQWGLYTTQLQRLLQDRLGRVPELRNGSYRCTLRVWLAADGTVERAESADTDACPAIRQAVLKLGRVHDAPPAGLPQPVVLRVANQP
jgi:protein TonB